MRPKIIAQIPAFRRKMSGEKMVSDSVLFEDERLPSFYRWHCLNIPTYLKTESKPFWVEHQCHAVFDVTPYIIWRHGAIALQILGATAPIWKEMASLSTAFLRLNSTNNCLLCQADGNDQKGQVNFTNKGWPTLKANAVKWREVNLPADDPFYLFPTVHEKICR